MDAARLLLDEIAEFCRRTGMAESTFGRRAVNDGKFVARMRFGGQVTTRTLERGRGFMVAHDGPGEPGAGRPSPAADEEVLRLRRSATLPATDGAARGAAATASRNNFRFYDNRQKYLLFVSTCSEKWVIAERAGMEMAHIHPKPPALRLFDAGMGDGTVLMRVMREMHHRFPTMPFYAVGKEISLEDVRLSLEKMPDRFYEHPATVLVLTNLYYSEAPWLAPKSLPAASALKWHEVPLAGATAHVFEQQIRELQPFLAEHWTVRASPRTGNPLYERPTVLILYRDDYKFLLDRVIPRPGETRAEFDLVIASQPYRARVPIEFKIEKVLSPLARSLGPGGRMLVVHSYGRDPGLEIIQRIWPGEDPFAHNRHDMLRALKAALSGSRRGLNFNAYADRRSLFTFHLHTLPEEIGHTIGTSTLLAAWNAAIYVAQVEDGRLAEAMAGGDYLETTKEVLQRHGGLWFLDESYVIARSRD
jgi:hypothetical protein